MGIPYRSGMSSAVLTLQYICGGRSGGRGRGLNGAKTWEVHLKNIFLHLSWYVDYIAVLRLDIIRGGTNARDKAEVDGRFSIIPCTVKLQQPLCQMAKHTDRD